MHIHVQCKQRKNNTSHKFLSAHAVSSSVKCSFTRLLYWADCKASVSFMSLLSNFRTAVIMLSCNSCITRVFRQITILLETFLMRIQCCQLGYFVLTVSNFWRVRVNSEKLRHVCPRVSAWGSRDTFSWNLMLRSVWETPDLVKVEQEHRALNVKTWLRLYCWQRYDGIL